MDVAGSSYVSAINNQLWQLLWELLTFSATSAIFLIGRKSKWVCLKKVESMSGKEKERGKKLKYLFDLLHCRFRVQLGSISTAKLCCVWENKRGREINHTCLSSCLSLAYPNTQELVLEKKLQEETKKSEKDKDKKPENVIF